MLKFFVSSTFRDMMSERDMLRNSVYPVLNQEVHSFGETVSFCDLRWGIDTKDLNEHESSKHVIQTCLNEIDKSQYMIVFLGSRYGWMPKEDYIKEIAKDRNLILEDYQISVTALEIYYGSLKSKESLENTLFYFRLPSPEDVPDDIIEKGKLESLKNKILSLSQNSVCFYRIVNNDGTLEMITENGIHLSEQIISDSQKLYVSKKKDWELISPSQRFAIKCTKLINDTADRFVSGFNNLYTLSECVNTNQFVSICSESGTGKTTLLCKFIKSRKNNDHVFYFPCNAFYDSKTIWQFQKQLTIFLESLLGVSSPIFPADKECATSQLGRLPQVSREQLKEYIELLLSKTAGPIYIIIDGIDTISTDELSARSDLLPYCLPENVRLLISYAKEPDFVDASFVRYSLELILDDDKSAVFKEVLAQNNKEIKASDIQSEITNKKSVSPLYYSLLAKRTLLYNKCDFEAINADNGGNIDAINRYIRKTIAEAPDSLGDIAVSILDTISSQIDAQRCNQILKYIAISYDGLRENELSELFGKDNLTWSSLVLYRLLGLADDIITMADDSRICFRNDNIKQAVYSALVKDKAEERRVLYGIKEIISELDIADKFLYSELPFYCNLCADDSKLITVIENHLTADNLENMEMLADKMIQIHLHFAQKQWLPGIFKNADSYGGLLNFTSFFNNQIHRSIIKQTSDRASFLIVYHELYNYEMKLYKRYSDLQIIDDIVETCFIAVTIGLACKSNDKAKAFSLQALQCALQLVKFDPNSRRYTYLVNAYLVCGDVEYEEGDYNKALEYYMRAFNLVHKNIDFFDEYILQVVVKSCTSLLDCMDICEEYTEIDNVTKFLSVYESYLQDADPILLLDTYRTLLRVAINKPNSISMSVKDLVSKVELLCSSKIKSRNLKTRTYLSKLASAYHEIGVSYLKAKQPEISAQYFIRSNTFLDEISSLKWTQEEIKLNKANQNNIALVYSENSDAYDNENENAPQLPQPEQDLELIVSTAIQKADKHMKKGNSKEALDILDDASDEIGNNAQTQKTLLLMFKCKAKQFQICQKCTQLGNDSRLKYYKSFLATVEDLYRVMPTYFPDYMLITEHILQIHIENNDIVSARQLCRRAFNLARSHYDKHGAGENLSDLFRYATVSLNLAHLTDSESEKNRACNQLMLLLKTVMDAYDDPSEIPHLDMFMQLFEGLKELIE